MNGWTRTPCEAIAVIGLGCLFPGARGAGAFWDLLRLGRTAIREVPAERWDAAALHDPDPAAAGRVLTRHGGFIDGAALFDPEFFGLSAREAKGMDPRQRLALKTAWWALEDAGIPGWSLKGRSVGVFLGASNGEFGGHYADLAAIGPHTGTGQATSVLANRVSYQLGLTGPSLVVDTACSSSLVAVHLACASLRAGECETALAGGVSLMLRPDPSVAFSRARMLAADGRCKSFAADADGYGRGEGAGTVVLKRLADAERDGDRILAMILGSAVNHNGQSNGITAPSTPAQEALIRQALAQAGLDPAAVDLVEAHGTGTLLGDPIEARALGHVLGRAAGREGPLPVGSVKSNIGHLEAAAGIAGLIKLTLSLHHGMIPPSLGFDAPNPHIDFKGLNLAVPTAPQALPDRGRAAVGGVSSFGFGGANCHMLVAAAPVPTRADRGQGPDWPQLLVLSAATPAALDRLAAATAARVGAEPDGAAALCRASHRSRSALRHRLSVAVPDAGALVRSLEAAASGRHSAVERGEAPRRPPTLAFLFSGQGAQFPGMAQTLLDRDATVRGTLEAAEAVTGLALSEAIREAGDGVNRTEVTQPLMFALQVGLARLWARWGIVPDMVIGHSLGDFAAAVVAGALEFEEAARLVAERGRLMARHARPGGMAAVAASAAAVEPLLEPGTVIAVHNGPETLTLAGEEAALTATLDRLAEAGIAARLLPVSAAFHSPAMDPVREPFRNALAALRCAPLRLPMVCTRTGTVLPAGTVLDAEFWVRHLREPVRFADGLAALAAGGAALGVEIGPAAVLSRLAPLSAPGLRVKPSLVRGCDDAACLLSALGGLWVAGHAPDWAAVDGPCQGRSGLPPYPFDETPFPLLADGTVPARPPAAVASATSSAVPAQERATAAPALDRLLAIVAALLETTPDRVNPATPFLEMGADSLVLVGAASRIEAAFGVKVPIRAFFEELSTPAALAAHLAALTPPAEPSVSVQPPGTPADGVVERVVREQLDLMRRQLELLEGRTHPPAPKPRLAALLRTSHPRPSRRAVTEADPFDARQRAHMDALIHAYTARTAASKALAARYRTVMADSRASAGFRPSVKEMLYPIACRSASGAEFEDVDGNRYLDISMGFGVHLFGHMPAFLDRALQESLARGLRLGPQSDRAGEAAERIARLAGQDRVAFLNSGTEAVMVALRLARTVTGRTRVVIFHGAYHGHFDGILADAADPTDSLSGGVPLVPGVAPGAVADTLVLEYGTPESLAALAPVLHEVAAVLVEPVQSRRPDLQPADFLRRLRDMTREAGAVLVFDELITGFRIAAGGAQAHFGVAADLVAYGKVLGGGLPIGVLAGRADLMSAVDGGVWSYGDRSAPAAETTLFAGTFNKNPLTIDSCLAVLTEIERRGAGLYDALNARTARLAERLTEVLAGTPIRLVRFGSMFRFVFSRNLDPFFYHLLLRGIYVWEGRTCFLSDAHTDADCDRVVAAVADTVAALHEGGFLEPAAPGPATLSTTLVPMSLAQRQLAALASIDPAGAAAYAVPLLLDLEGPLDIERLAGAVAAVGGRHDGLWAAMDPLAGTVSLTAPGTLHLELCDAAEVELELAVRDRLARPFDLARPPLLRAALFRLAPGRAALLLIGHHAAVDGLSLQVLAAELADAYAGRPLPPAASLRALTDAHARADADGRWRTARDWWLKTLRDAPGGLDLDIAAPRPPVRGFVGGRVVRELDAGLAERLRRRAAGASASLLMVLLAGFAWLMHRYGGGRDLVIGVPYAGRAIAGEQAARLVGYCTHLLPLHLAVDPEGGTASLVAAVRGALLDALEHADYPFARILEDLAPRRDPARPPLVPVTFNLDRVEALPRFGAEVAARLHPLGLGAARFDLACNVVECAGRLTVELDYDAALFGGGRAERLADAFVTLLSRLAEPGDHPLRDAPTLWTGAVSSGPAPVLLPARFRDDAHRDPAGPAIVLDGKLRLDRAALDRWSAAVAAAIADAGAGPGAVALLLPRTEAIPAAMLGCWRAGRAWVPIEPGTPPDRVAALISLAGCALALRAEDGGVPTSGGVPALALPPCPPPGAAPEPGPDVAVDPEAPAYILFTSGSTGQPKPVVVPHQAVAWYLDGLLARTGLPRGMSCGLASTFSADLGLTSVLPALFHGGTLCIQSESAARDPQLFAEAQRRWPVDLLKIVPLHLEALLAGAPSTALLPRRLLVLGGERAAPALLGRLAELAPDGLRVMNHYGPTEATVGVAMGDWRRGEGRLRLDAPLAGARIAVLDDGGDPVPPGGTGEIHIGGPQLALGYAGQAEETTRRFRPQPRSGIAGPLYATGDLARLDADGTLELLGRRDDQVKIRGYRVEPGEVAATLRTLPQVAAAAVVAVECPVGGTVLVAYVVPAPVVSANGDADAAVLARRLCERLPAHMQPARIVLCTALPLTANGKLDRAALAGQGWDDAPPLGAPPGAPPLGSPALPAAEGAEAALLAVWRELFGRPAIGPHDDFFALGGDSILGIRMVGRLHQEGFRLLATDLYRHPTAAALAPLLRAVGTEAEQGALDGAAPLLPSQHRWLALDAGLRPQANLSLLLELAPEVTPARVTAAFARLMAQHDGLRLRARADGASAVQEFAPPGAPPLHRVPAEADPAAQLDRLQALADPTGDGVVLGWLEGTPARLLIVLHHWLVDAVSCVILLEDLARLLCDPGTCLGPKTLSVRQWGEALATRAAGTAVLDQTEFWTVSTGLPPPALPLRPANALSGRQGAEASAAVTLSEPETRELLGGPAVLAGLEVEDVLLAGLTLAMADLTGEPLLYVELEGHGRTPPPGTPEPSRTVGWFTARHPAWIDLAGVAEEQAAATVREQRLSLPNRGLDYGLLRWMGPAAVRARLAVGHAPLVSFNYLGRLPGLPEAPFRLLSWRPGCPQRGAERAADLPRPQPIAVEAMLLDDRLRLDVLYDATLLDAEAMERMAAALAAAVLRIARLPPRMAPPALDADDLAALALSP